LPNAGIAEQELGNSAAMIPKMHTAANAEPAVRPRKKKSSTIGEG
jgi:hypothetical protein